VWREVTDGSNFPALLPAVQVSIMEDEEQNIHFKNLSVHRAGSEEEALNLVRDMLRAMRFA